MEPRTCFSFQRHFWEVISMLPTQRARYALFEAICLYALDGAEPKLTGSTAAAFAGLRFSLDLSRQRAQWGQKGGNSRQANAKQTRSKPEALRKVPES